MFLSQFFVILLKIFGCFWRFHLSKTCDEFNAWLGFLCSAALYVLLSPRLWTSYFLQKIAYLYLWLVSPRRESHNLFTIGSKKFRQKFTFFNNIPDTLCVMQEEIEILEFVQGVYFKLVDSLKNKGTNYLLIFDDSGEDICNSKAFVDIATAGRHRRLSNIYIELNLFYQSKLGQNVELQNRQTVHSISLRVVMQIKFAYCTFGTRIRGSWLVSGRNICSLRSFIDWLLATHRRLITLLYKHRIHSYKTL